MTVMQNVYEGAMSMKDKLEVNLIEMPSCPL